MVMCLELRRMRRSSNGHKTEPVSAMGHERSAATSSTVGPETTSPCHYVATWFTVIASEVTIMALEIMCNLHLKRQ